jgi:hypothetical protein
MPSALAKVCIRSSYLGEFLDQAIKQLIPPGERGTNIDTGGQVELAMPSTRLIVHEQSK